MKPYRHQGHDTSWTDYLPLGVAKPLPA